MRNTVTTRQYFWAYRVLQGSETAGHHVNSPALPACQRPDQAWFMYTYSIGPIAKVRHGAQSVELA